jgi:hypothetical protein
MHHADDAQWDFMTRSTRISKTAEAFYQLKGLI